MVRLFVRPDKEILEIVKMGIQKCNNNLLEFSREVKICRTTIYHWFEKKIWIDIEKLKRVCNFLKIDHLNYIKGKLVHSTRSKPELFSDEWFKINPRVALFLGWVCTEGHIPKKNCSRITIAQNDRRVLRKLKEIIVSEYPIKNKIKIRPQEDGKKNTLEIGSPMLWYILVNHFEIEEGKKNFTVSIPKQVLGADKKSKLAFLSASVEGDGSWPPDSINIRMTSKDYIIQCYNLFKELEYNAIYGKLSQENTWIVQICSKKDICRFIFESSPYLIAITKLEHFFYKSFLENYLYKGNYIRIDWKIVKSIREKLNLKRGELRDLIGRETGFFYTKKWISEWTGYRKKRENLKLRLPIVILLSKMVNDAKIIPNEYSWIENAYRTKKFQSMVEKYESRQKIK